MKDDFADPRAVEARFSTDLPGVVNDYELPNEIQWAPPGNHTITASRAGKPVTLTLHVDERAAQRVADAHSSYMAAANQGHGDLPYFDFNHDDEEASAHPKAFRWGGPDLEPAAFARRYSGRARDVRP